MKNCIVIHTDISNPVDLRWGHNDQELGHGKWSPQMQICIDRCESDNTFWIHNDSTTEYEILDVNMYGFGQGKIKYWGKFFPASGHPSWNSHVIHSLGRWQLDWQYPTFTWLHHSLGMGWLVKPAE